MNAKNKTVPVSYTTPEVPFTLPPELEELKTLVREVVERECIPLESKYLANNPDWVRGGIGGETGVDGTLEEKDWQRLRDVVKSTGLDVATLPEEFGGMGYGILGGFVLAEERNRSIVPLPIPSVANPLYACNEEQREKYLMPVVRGEISSCFAQTEPDAGSDPGGMRTKAVHDGEGWVINGAKTFISGAKDAAFQLLLAVTDEEKGSKGGITMFLVDTDTPGITMQPVPIWTANYVRQYTIFYDDVRVPDSAVLGTVGGGFALGQYWLAIQDRLTRGSLASGILSRGLDMATEYVQNRHTFGQPLADRQAIQWMLVDILVDLKSIRALSYECAARADQGQDVRAYAAIAKLTGANWGHRSVDKLMQIFGGHGEALDSPIPHWYRQLRHGRIGGGTDEIQRILIQRALFKEGKDLWQA